MSAQDRIRKDVGELTLQDLLSAPAWEFCLDEEDVEGQTECTVRPAHPRGPVEHVYDAVIAADFTTPSGRVLTGIISLNGGPFQGPWICDPTLFFLPLPVGRVTDHPLLHKYNKIMSADSPRICLSLPWPAHQSDPDVRALINLAYQALDLLPDQLFPLTCRPRVQIKDWPQSFSIPGFVLPVDRGGEVFESVL